jgi:regulator of cell morphogenesis and NO signaling
MNSNATPQGHRKINDLVNENHVFASVLYYFGIGYYDFEEKTLREVCEQHGLDFEQVVSSLESVNKRGEEFDLYLLSYPVPLIIEYLKHKHHEFVKKKLPFIVTLVEHLQGKNEAQEEIVADLKFVFPLFIEDFIRHIYQEEDTLFQYILDLENALKGQYKPGVLLKRLGENSLQKFAIEHDVHEDEMRGIRNITNNYALDSDMGLEFKVLYKELLGFEKMLEVHAKVEDEVLFPKALELERRVRLMMQNKIKLN